MSQEVNPTVKNQEFTVKLDELIKKHEVIAHVSAYSFENGQTLIGISGNGKIINCLISEILKAKLDNSIQQILNEEVPEKSGILTKEEITELKELYKKAISNNEKQFSFKETFVLTEYAKHLINFLDSEEIRKSKRTTAKGL